LEPKSVASLTLLEPVSELVSEPVYELVSEPVSELVSDLVSESAAEPAIESATALAAEPVIEPSAGESAAVSNMALPPESTVVPTAASAVAQPELEVPIARSCPTCPTRCFAFSLTTLVRQKRNDHRHGFRKEKEYELNFSSLVRFFCRRDFEVETNTTVD
jgi:hypothetical protein